jgi:hypothetical protein
MKVLDLQCGAGHAFEGWFGSEDDFVGQRERGMVQCPLCGDAHILKKPSAPRLNLHTARGRSQADEPATSSETPTAAHLAKEVASHTEPSVAPEVVARWMQLARQIVAQTDDVGNAFADVARKMHYGETPERAIRGKTTADEARALVDEGIDIVPLVLPEALKEPLQ